jgi:hypothetical protein
LDVLKVELRRLVGLCLLLPHGDRGVDSPQDGGSGLGFRFRIDSEDEEATMNDEKKPVEPEEDVPAHSTEEEKERLKDFNKDGIPPGIC